MGVFVDLIRFIIILGILIFIHELGHFLVAKKVGIYVFRFSIGFGKRLFGWKHKGTDYCISAIPFGGYVKMAGQEDLPGSEETAEEIEQDPDLAVKVPAEQKFCNKSVKERLGVVIAGPAMNFFLGLVLFALAYAVGMHVPAYTHRTVIGDVATHSPAEKAGLQPGDEIVSINGKKVSQWRDITKTTLFNIGNKLDLEIKRNETVVHAQVTPAYYDKKANPGIGIIPYIKSQIKEVIPGSPASTAGLKTGDIIEQVNGKPVGFTTIAKEIRSSETSNIALTIIRDRKSVTVNVTPEVIGNIKDIEFYENTVSEVNNTVYPDIKVGDKLVAIDDIRFEKPDDSLEKITPKIGKKVLLHLERTEKWLWKSKIVSYTTEVYVDRGYKIGVYFEPDQETILEKYPVPIAVLKGAERTFMSVYELFASLYFLVTGKISPRELAGPVGIYKITSDFAKSGFVILLSLVAFLSVNLSVINLLPVPVLDGGHVLFLIIESILRRPLNEKIVEICQKIGFALLMALIIFTFYNDIVHRIFGN